MELQSKTRFSRLLQPGLAVAVVELAEADGALAAAELERRPVAPGAELAAEAEQRQAVAALDAAGVAVVVERRLVALERRAAQVEIILWLKPRVARVADAELLPVRALLLQPGVTGWFTWKLISRMPRALLFMSSLTARLKASAWPIVPSSEPGPRVPKKAT
jgi:hypothetical protein